MLLETGPWHARAVTVASTRTAGVCTMILNIIGGAVPPNEWRLSCGAGLEHSQGEFYHTARKTFSGSLGAGAASFKRWLGCAPQLYAEILL